MLSLAAKMLWLYGNNDHDDDHAADHGLDDDDAALLAITK